MLAKLPIAIAILAASEQVNAYLLADSLFLGELSLDDSTIYAQENYNLTHRSLKFLSYSLL